MFPDRLLWSIIFSEVRFDDMTSKCLCASMYEELYYGTLTYRIKCQEPRSGEGTVVPIFTVTRFYSRRNVNRRVVRLSDPDPPTINLLDEHFVLSTANCHYEI